MKYVIRFRYVPPYEYMTPLIHLPIEETNVDAETPELAWATFLNGFPKEKQGWIRREEIYQYT
jgi:hypothetical protein